MHQTAEAPDIDAVRVGIAKDDLRCDGALSSDPPSERVRGRSKLRGATKVRNTGLSLGALIRHQNVPQFDVAMNNSEAVQILNSLRNLTDDVADPCLAEGKHTMLQHVVVQAEPRHVLCHYDMIVLIFGVVNELQGVSASACSDLFQQFDFLRRLIARGKCFFKVLLVNEFDRYFELGCLVLCQDHFAEATLTEQVQLDVLGKQSVALVGLVLANLQKAIEKLFTAIKEDMSLDASDECEYESLAVLLARLRFICR